MVAALVRMGGARNSLTNKFFLYLTPVHVPLRAQRDDAPFAVLLYYFQYLGLVPPSAMFPSSPLTCQGLGAGLYHSVTPLHLTLFVTNALNKCTTIEQRSLPDHFYCHLRLIEQILLWLARRPAVPQTLIR